MATSVLGLSKRTLANVLTANAALFGVAGVLAPRALEAAYAVPSTPHTTQLVRLFGSRMLSIAAWSFTARTKEEVDRVLTTAAAVNLVDVVTALASARSVGRTSAVRAAATSGTFAALAFVVHSLED